jgi:hypothetical protein
MELDPYFPKIEDFYVDAKERHDARARAYAKSVFGSGNSAELLLYLSGYRGGKQSGYPIDRSNAMMPKDMSGQRNSNDSLSNIYRELKPLEKIGILKGSKRHPRYLANWVLESDVIPIIKENPELEKANLYKDEATIEKLRLKLLKYSKKKICYSSL